jgi:alpha-tubulin suppressor-like RCC1 family protein
MRFLALVIVPATLAVLSACSGGPTDAVGGVSVFAAPPGPPWNGSATAVTVGERANCLLATDGTPWCWGNTRGFGLRIDIGLRGVPQSQNSDVVIDSICIAHKPVDSLPGWPCNVFHPVRLSTRTFASLRESPWDSPLCGLDPAGGAFCWDAGAGFITQPDSTVNGQEYCGASLCLLAPQRVRTGQPLRYYSSGFQAPCAVTVAGAVLCASDNRNNLFGNLSTNFRSDTLYPVLGAPASTALAVAMDGNFACAIATTGKVHCWGSNLYGQVGINSNTLQITTPTQVVSAFSFTAIAATLWSVCALASGGQAYCWGDSRGGQVGWGGLGTSKTPYPVTGGRAFTAITGGVTHFCALDGGGAAWCWGDNYYGQLGIDRVISATCGGALCSSVPVAVQGGHIFRQISAGGVHTCGVTTANEVFCWGNAAYGRLGQVLLSQDFNATPVKITP